MKLTSSRSRITAQELAVMLGITEETVIKLTNTGQLPCIKENRRIYFSLDEIISHLRSMEGAAA